jgi:hypothetical protein
VLGLNRNRNCENWLVIVLFDDEEWHEKWLGNFPIKRIKKKNSSHLPLELSA